MPAAVFRARQAEENILTHEISPSAPINRAVVLVGGGSQVTGNCCVYWLHGWLRCVL